MTDVSVWPDNFSLFTILLIPFLIIIFISGDVLTDVSVWAGQTMYSAHRLVLALSSSYFRLHFIISFFLAPILNMCSLIDLMGKSMTKKVGQMMWCGSYQNNRKTLDRVQQRSSPKLLSEYMILLREPFHVKFLDLFQLIHLILSKPHPRAPLYIGLICCFSCVTFLHCVIVNAPSMCPITSNWSHIYNMLFLFQICGHWRCTRGKIPRYIS